METQWKLNKQIPTEVKNTKIISYRKTNKQQCTVSTLLLGGGNSCNKKRKNSDPPEPAPHPSSNQHTAEYLALMLDTCTDTEFTTKIQPLPSNWQATNCKGTLVTKSQLQMSNRGSYRDDESIHNFHLAILQTRPPPHPVT